MKRLKSILLFFGIFFIGQWIISLVFESLLSQSNMRFSKLYFSQTEMQGDILCIGNSRGVNSFYAPYINQKYSVQSYNLSYNGLTMPMVDIVLNDYLDKNSSPKAVFIEVSNIFVPGSSTKYSEFNLYSAKSKELKAQIKNTDKRCHVISSLLPLYRYNSELLYRSLFYTLKSSDQDWINRYSISEEMVKEVGKMPFVELNMEATDLKTLERIVEKLNAESIGVYLFIAPYLPAYLEKIEDLDTQIAKIENEIGVPVIDISGLIAKSEYFADRVHTNEAGATVIADTLMSIMANHNSE